MEEKSNLEEIDNTEDKYQKLLEKFKSILNTNKIIKIEELRDLSWHGTPLPYKSITWKLLLGYLPSNTKRHEQILKQKDKLIKTPSHNKSKTTKSYKTPKTTNKLGTKSTLILKEHILTSSCTSTNLSKSLSKECCMHGP